MELSRLRPGELIAAAGGVALLVVMFLDWYAVGGTTSVGGSDVRISLGLTAWEAFGITDILLALAALIAIGLAVITAARRSPALPVAASVITSTTGILATLLVLYRILNQPGPNEFVEVEAPGLPRLPVRAGDRRRRLALDARRAVGGRAGAHRRAPGPARRGPARACPAARGRAARLDSTAAC